MKNLEAWKIMVVGISVAVFLTTLTVHGFSYLKEKQKVELQAHIVNLQTELEMAELRPVVGILDKLSKKDLKVSEAMEVLKKPKVLDSEDGLSRALLERYDMLNREVARLREWNRTQ